MADTFRTKAVRISLTLTFLLFACSSEDANPEGGSGDKSNSGSVSGAGGAAGRVESDTNGAGIVTEGDPISGAGAAGGSAESGTSGVSSGGTGPDTGNTGGSIRPDSAVVPSVDAGDGESTDVNPADSNTGDEKWNGPYANVVAVSASGEPGNYNFSVSVESSDVDCSQYASWWEVLTEDGTLVFRRILAHPHTDENGTSDPGAPGNTFTRSGEPIDIEADEVVIIRAHMNTGGYHGDVMRGSVESGFIVALDIDTHFAAEVEFEEPQPDGCREM